jgi:ADP-ribose pyrophosphatase YjhB (NUDIX family)
VRGEYAQRRPDDTWHSYATAFASCPCAASREQHEQTQKIHLDDCIQSSVADGCCEVPAGGLSPGLTPEEGARRELVEEVGGRAAELCYVGEFYTSNGISNERAYVCLAAGVELGEAHREPTELMEIRLEPVDEALSMAREGEVTDGPSASALLWCAPLLQPQSQST